MGISSNAITSAKAAPKDSPTEKAPSFVAFSPLVTMSELCKRILSF
jgi:hypothetical protein